MNALTVVVVDRLRAQGVRCQADIDDLTDLDVCALFGVVELCDVEWRALRRARDVFPGPATRCGLHGDSTSSGRCSSCDLVEGVAP